MANKSEANADAGDVSEDLRLINESLDGNPEAFRRLIEKYKKYVYNVSWRLLGSEQEAEDVTQETFLKLYQQLADYKPDHKLSNWLYTVAINASRNRLRKKKVLQIFSLDRWVGTDDEELALELPAKDHPPDKQLEDRETQEYVSKLIALLPDSLKTPFVLHYIQNLPEEEIADIQGISINNVRVKIYRAKMYLWKKIDRTTLQ